MKHPSRPTIDDDEDEELERIEREEKLADLLAIRRYVEQNDIDGLTEEKMRMVYFGVDPSDVVLVEDSSQDTGYRVMLTEEHLEEREYQAELEESLSAALRHDLGVPSSEIEAMDGLAELADAFVSAASAYLEDGDHADDGRDRDHDHDGDAGGVVHADDHANADANDRDDDR